MTAVGILLILLLIVLVFMYFFLIYLASSNKEYYIEMRKSPLLVTVIFVAFILAFVLLLFDKPDSFQVSETSYWLAKDEQGNPVFSEYPDGYKFSFIDNDGKMYEKVVKSGDVNLSYSNEVAPYATEREIEITTKLLGRRSTIHQYAFVLPMTGEQKTEDTPEAE